MPCNDRNSTELAIFMWWNFCQCSKYLAHATVDFLTLQLRALRKVYQLLYYISKLGSFLLLISWTCFLVFMHNTLGNWWKKVVAVTVVFTSFLSEWSTAGTACRRMILMQLLSTASRTVWRGEENVRWTFLKTECLQVPWLHQSVGMGECSIWFCLFIQSSTTWYRKCKIISVRVYLCFLF